MDLLVPFVGHLDLLFPAFLSGILLLSRNCPVGLYRRYCCFCIGSFAVLVPTPNRAGPWHFAVKTVLVLYGISGQAAIMFALVVHTLQTLLIVLLGVYGWVDLAVIGRRK